MDHTYIYKEGLFKRKIILVIFATSGIGYKTSWTLSKLEAKLITIRRSISKIKKLKNLLEDTLHLSKFFMELKNLELLKNL